MAKYFCGIDWYGSRPWVYKHLGFTATIIDHFSSPNGFPEGLAGDADGNVISGDENGKIYKHDGFSSTVIDSFSRYQSDITWYDSNLYSVLGTKVYKHSGFSASITDSFSSTQQIAIGVAWDGSNICETSYDTSEPLLLKTYKHSGFSSSIIQSFAGGVGPNQYGGWFDSCGGNLYGMDHSEEQYDRMVGFTGEVNFSIAMSEGQSHGLAWIEGEPLFDSGIRVFGGDAEGGLCSVDKTINKIYKHSGFSSSITDSFSSPSVAPGGLTWDGTNIYSTDYAIDKIYKHSGFSSSITDSFSSPSAAPMGLAWDGTNLMSGDSYADKIYKHNGFSSSITDSFSGPSTVTVGLTWDGTNLMSCDRDPNKIYKHSGFSSSITDSFSSPSTLVAGLAWDGTNLMSSDYNTDKIYKHSGFSSSITDSFSSPSVAPMGLAWGTEIIEKISIGYRDLKSTHKLRYNKGGTTVVGIPLVESADPVASKIRVFDGSAFKSIAKYEV